MSVFSQSNTLDFHHFCNPLCTIYTAHDFHTTHLPLLYYSVSCNDVTDHDIYGYIRIVKQNNPKKCQKYVIGENPWARDNNRIQRVTFELSLIPTKVHSLGLISPDYTVRVYTCIVISYMISNIIKIISEWCCSVKKCVPSK